MPQKPARPIKSESVVYCLRTHLPTGQVFVQKNTRNTYTIHSDSRNFVNSPNWKVIIANGLDASNNYLATGGYAKAARLRGVQVSPTERYNYFGSVVPPGPGSYFGVTTDDAIRDIALHRLKERIRSNLGQSVLGEPLAEAGKLHGLIRQAAGVGTDTLNALIALRRNPKLGSKKLAKLAADTWLGYCFGVKPVISDIDNSIRSLQDYLDRQDHVKHVWGTAKKNGVVGNSNAASYAYTNYSNITASDHGEYELRYKYTGAFRYKVSSGNHYTVSRHIGLSGEQVIPTLWELTYASWIADYFANIGDYLEDIFWVPPGTLQYLVLDRQYTGRVWRVLKPVNSGSAVQQSFSATNAELDYWLFERTKLSTLPHTGMHVKTADQVGKHAVNKLLNLSAFLAKRSI